MFNLSVSDFFGGIHIGSYVCALKPDVGQFNGLKVDEAVAFHGSYDELFEKEFFPLNQVGWGVHYTPNGIKARAEKNRKDNISHVNAWILEIDIEESKEIKEEADMEFRVKRKEELRGVFFGLPETIWPSLICETRNGFQVSWFALDGKLENYERIEDALHLKFANWGADRSGMNLWSMFRVPYMRYYKKGEQGVVLPFELCSTLRLYPESAILDFLQEELAKGDLTSQKKKEDELFYSKAIKLEKFPRASSLTGVERILKTPVAELLLSLSGREEVSGDIITLSAPALGKQQVLVGGQITPNWIDLEKNLIFSNNISGMANLIHYLEYYGHSKKEAIKLLSSLCSKTSAQSEISSNRNDIIQ